MRAWSVTPWIIICPILLIYVALGCVFESLSVLLLTVPIISPLVHDFGFNPAWFGTMVVGVTEISLITPPFSLNLFVLRGEVGNVSKATVFPGVAPFRAADILRPALLTLYVATQMTC